MGNGAVGLRRSPPQVRVHEHTSGPKNTAVELLPFSSSFITVTNGLTSVNVELLLDAEGAFALLQCDHWLSVQLPGARWPPAGAGVGVGS